MADQLRLLFYVRQIAATVNALIRDAGLPPRWNDERVSLVASNSAPAFGTVSGVIKGWLFDPAGEEELHVRLQLPNSYNEGSAVRPHLHWTPTTGDAGRVVWGFQYQWAAPGGTFSSATSVLVTASAAGVIAHNVLPLATLTLSAATIQSLLFGRLYRAGGNSADTYPADACLLALDFALEHDTRGAQDELSKGAAVT